MEATDQEPKLKLLRYLEMHGEPATDAQREFILQHRIVVSPTGAGRPGAWTSGSALHSSLICHLPCSKVCLAIA